MCADGSCGCNGMLYAYWPYDRAPWEDAGPPMVQARILGPTRMGASLAGAWMRTNVNQIEGTEYDQAEIGIVNASAVTRPWLAGPNVDTGFVQAVRGTLAEGQWAAQIKNVEQSNQLGRP